MPNTFMIKCAEQDGTCIHRQYAETGGDARVTDHDARSASCLAQWSTSLSAVTNLPPA